MAALRGGEARFGTLNEAQARRMLETPPEEDGPFWMINLIKYREKADYADGRETELTGREADALYAPQEFLEAIGAVIEFVGDVDDTLISPDGVEWEQIAIVRYPSRAKFFELVRNEEFQARAIHKDAGVEKSLVIVSELEETQALPEPSVIPNPPTASDPPALVTHLLRYREVAMYPPGSDEPARSGRDAMALYEAAAAGVALEQGGAPVARFAIEGVYIGDGRVWDEFRINRFPSRAAFDVVAADPTRQAGEFHRIAALEDTYSTAGTSIINRFAGGGDGGSDGAVLEVTDNGTGTLCATDADCGALTANRCVGADGAGFCSVQGCSAGTCEGSYVCCRDCADFAADLLPFQGSACVPGALSAQLTDAPACTCD